MNLKHLHKNSMLILLKGAVAEALPLAEKPHLLQPTVRREDLFGLPMTSGGQSGLGEIQTNNLGLSSRHEDKGNYAALLERKPLTTVFEESRSEDRNEMEIEEEIIPITTKPPPLFKMSQAGASTSPTKNWDVPQDLSMNKSDDGDQASRAPIIVSPKKSGGSMDARSPAKSVIVCPRTTHGASVSLSVSVIQIFR